MAHKNDNPDFSWLLILLIVAPIEMMIKWKIIKSTHPEVTSYWEYMTTYTWGIVSLIIIGILIVGILIICIVDAISKKRENKES